MCCTTYHSECVFVAFGCSLVRVELRSVSDRNHTGTGLDHELIAGAALYAVHHAVVRGRTVCVTGFYLHK